MKEKNTTENVPITFHASSSSVGVEIPIHESNISVCVDNISYCDGEVKMELTFKSKTEKDKKKKKKQKEKNISDIKEFVMFKSFLTFNVISGAQKKDDTKSVND